MTGRIALIGDPVAESVSPDMQNAALRACGLDLEYVALRVTRDEVARRFPELAQETRGMNVTIPLKDAVARLVDVVADSARGTMSVNTVVVGDGGRTTGHSTDGAGFLRALRHAGLAPRSALILGAGGAARAIAAALRSAGLEVAVTARDLAAAEAMRPLGVRPIDQASAAAVASRSDLIVSAVPSTAWRDGDAFHIASALRPGRIVADLAYRPRRTPLLARAEAAGCAVLEGVEMLVEQGALSFSLWTGREAPLEIMRGAAYAALERPPVAP
ncbi:MAG TPA: NAD(P)-binding domain-containing protein [Candidatus Limnocylindria bacterium]|nr:NAD(P)-binding domain-containing protein [Candidatus Limnocylindria bacterium]